MYQTDSPPSLHRRTRRAVLSAVGCSCLLLPSIALANARPIEEHGGLQNSRPLTRPTESRQDEGEAAAPTRSSAGSLLTTCGALGLVLMLIFGLARAGRQRRAGGPGTLNDAVFEVLGTRRLTVKQSLQLVRIGSRILVLGVSDSGIETLSEITDPREVEHLADACRATAADSGGQPLRAMYDQFLRQIGRPGSKATSSVTATRRISELEEPHRA